MQIDDRWHEFARTGNWRDAEDNIDYGTALLAANIKRYAAEWRIPGYDRLRAALAAYNCGCGRVDRAIARYSDVDYYTTGRDYSSDVLARAERFVEAMS
jgi:soluble lytic murein transglycosylase-like protein